MLQPNSVLQPASSFFHKSKDVPLWRDMKHNFAMSLHSAHWVAVYRHMPSRKGHSQSRQQHWSSYRSRLIRLILADTDTSIVHSLVGYTSLLTLP